MSLPKETTLGLLAITATFDRIVELCIAYQEGRITANDFAETVANVLQEVAPLIRPIEAG